MITRIYRVALCRSLHLVPMSSLNVFSLPSVKILGRFDIFTVLEYILAKLQSARREDWFTKQPALLKVSFHYGVNFTIFARQNGLRWVEFLTLLRNNYALILILHIHEHSLVLVLNRMTLCHFLKTSIMHR